MNKKYRIAIETVDKFVNEKRSFTYGELVDEIVRKKGVLKVSVGSSIDDYLEYYIKTGKLDFDSWKMEYIPKRTSKKRI